MNTEVGQEIANRLRCGIYTRSASEKQGSSAHDNQTLRCRGAAAEQGWIVDDESIFHDPATSGTPHTQSNGLKALIERASRVPRPFDILLVTDTSRLSRDLEVALKAIGDLSHCGVSIYVIDQKLDSRDKNFRLMLTMVAMCDEQSVSRLAKRVHSGQMGRVLAGYNPGSRCFGYSSVHEEQPSRMGGTRQTAIMGSRLEIIPEEAATIRRIGEMFADGFKVHQIQKILIAEKIPAARNSSVGDVPSAWNASLINRILRNEKYIGVAVWNRTKQSRNAETGSIEIHQKPQNEIVRVELPHLRIMSDDLWGRVQARIKIVNQKVALQPQGGVTVEGVSATFSTCSTDVSAATG